MSMAEKSGWFTDSTREFNPFPDRPKIRLEVAAMSHPGLCRENNEDSFLTAGPIDQVLADQASHIPHELTIHVGDASLFLVVADGMGGVEGGEVASSLAIQTLKNCLHEGIKLLDVVERTDETTLIRELRSAVEKADEAVVLQAQKQPSLLGMGTTLTLAYGVANTFYIVHAGDSRAYHYHQNKLKQITTDHTFVQMLVRGGMITAKDARTHARRNVVTNIVGGPEGGVYSEHHTVVLDDADILLLCSDGLTEALEDHEIESILLSQLPLKTAVNALIEKCLENGAPDNVTVILVKAHHEN
jgi:protein phosphatase